MTEKKYDGAIVLGETLYCPDCKLPIIYRNMELKNRNSICKLLVVRGRCQCKINPDEWQFTYELKDFEGK